MKLIKSDSEQLISIDVKVANSFTARLRGLMFRKQLPSDEALWLIPCNSIHMFFMRFPLDVVFMDYQGTIVRLVEGIAPWKAVMPVTGAYSALELTVGTIRRCNMEVGDRLELP